MGGRGAHPAPRDLDAVPGILRMQSEPPRHRLDQLPWPGDVAGFHSILPVLLAHDQLSPSVRLAEGDGLALPAVTLGEVPVDDLDIGLKSCGPLLKIGSSGPSSVAKADSVLAHSLPTPAFDLKRSLRPTVGVRQSAGLPPTKVGQVAPRSLPEPPAFRRNPRRRRTSRHRAGAWTFLL